MSAGEPRMALQRFEALAQAYGAAFSRWPAEEREPARRLAASDRAAAAVLARAAGLDRALALSLAPTPGSALVGRAMASAEGVRRRAWRWLTGAGIGVAPAGATAAGVAAGALLGPAAWAPAAPAAAPLHH